MLEYPSSPASNSLAGSLTGKTVGRFVVKERLGKGGMGEVYRAEDSRLKRPVALKRLSPSLRSDPLYNRRFQEEAERASRFSDSHVAAVYDVIEDQEDIFLVMEFVEGQTLRQRLLEPMNLEDFLKIAVQCAEALVAAHDRGILHCDIKPENVMLTPTGQVKILDFGVAKYLPRSDQSSTVERSGTVGGTPAYMSPEVLLEKTPDGRADIFSLGIVLYETLAGHHPFLSDSYVATTHRIIHEKPAPIRIFNAKVPEELEEIIRRAMAKEPSDRYADAREMLDDLRNFQGGVTPSKLGWVLKHSRKKPRRVVAWAGLLSVIVAMVLLAVLGPTRIKRWLGWSSAVSATRQLAILPFTPSSDDVNSRAFAEGLTETITVRLTQLTSAYPLEIVPPREINREAIQSAGQARQKFNVNLVLEGSLRESNNMVRVSYTLVDAATLRQLRADTVTVEASKPFDVEDRLLESVVSMLGLELRPGEKAALLAHGTAEPAAYDYYLRGRGYLQEYQKPQNLDSAITVFQHALERDPNYALAYAGLGEAYWKLFDIKQDNTLVDKAADNCRHAISLAANLANGHICLGTVYNGTGQYERAAQEFQRAVQIDSTSDDAYRGLGDAYDRLGKVAEAEQTFQRAIQLRPQYFGGYSSLGYFYYDHARYDDAARMFTTQIALAPDNGRGYNNLGAVYLAQGRYVEAIPQLQRAAAIQPSAAAYSNVATAFFFQRNYSQAARTYEQAVQSEGNSFRIWANLAEAYYWTPGERPRAAEAYLKSIKMAEEALQVNEKDLLALRTLALCHAMLNDSSQAQLYLARALKDGSNSADVQFYAGKVYSQLKQNDAAIMALQKAIKLGCPKNWLKDDPVFEPLANDVRYQALVK